jgi:hypothetical protein
LPRAPESSVWTIYAKNQIPIGLILSAMGGTTIRQWVTPDLSDDIWYHQCGHQPDAVIVPPVPIRVVTNQDVNTPGSCFSGTISPIVGFGIKGVAWWQGESDAMPPNPIDYYAAGAFRQLIRQWRQLWGQGNFPFVFVQLQQISGVAADNVNIVRDQQMQALDEPNTAMSICFDSTDGVHPGKYTPSMRLAQAANAVAYGASGEYMGPIYSGFAIEGSSIRVLFAHKAGGLIKKEIAGFEGNNNLAVGANALSSSADPDAPFEIAGADGVYHRADAVIDNNTVVVSSPAVPAPKNVRYGFEYPNPAKTPLYNTINLPASTFCTNTWAGLGSTPTIDGFVLSDFRASPSSIVDNVSISVTLSVDATVPGGIAGVTIDLSPIGGGASAPMTKTTGPTYSVPFTTLPGVAPGAKNLRVTAVDNGGHKLYGMMALTVVDHTAPVMVSRGKSITASSTQDVSVAAGNVVDGDMATRWSSNVSDPQWISVDLGSSMHVNQVILRWEAAYAKSYKVQVSTDATAWADVFSTTTGDGGIDSIAFAPISGRYVRMYGTQRGTAYGYSLYEFEVFAAPSGATVASASARHLAGKPRLSFFSNGIGVSVSNGALWTLELFSLNGARTAAFAGLGSKEVALAKSADPKGFVVAKLKTHTGEIVERAIVR